MFQQSYDWRLALARQSLTAILQQSSPRLSLPQSARYAAPVSSAPSRQVLAGPLRTVTGSIISFTGSRTADQMPTRPRNLGMRWTYEDEQKMITLHRQGRSFSYIAEELGRSDYGIECRLQQAGVIPHTIPDVVPIGPMAPPSLAVNVLQNTCPPTQPAQVLSTAKPCPVAAELLLNADDADEFTCTICQEICVNVVMISACGHDFCHHCLQNHRRSASSNAALCPNCRTRIDIVHPDMKVQRAIDNAKSRCEDEQCTWTGRVADYETHVCVKKTSQRILAKAAFAKVVKPRNTQAKTVAAQTTKKQNTVKKPVASSKKVVRQTQTRTSAKLQSRGRTAPKKITRRPSCTTQKTQVAKKVKRPTKKAPSNTTHKTKMGRRSTRA